jgi:glutathione S-transferase
MKPVIYHIPVCPFSQRVKILLHLKGLQDEVDFEVVDITKPRAPWLLKKSGGTTALPLLDLGQDRIIKESRTILDFFEEHFPDIPVTRADPYERAIERMLIATEGDFTMTGYMMVMNQAPDKRWDFVDKMLGHYRNFDTFLRQYNPEGVFLFEDFGMSEVIYTPIFMRFWFLDYYEGFDIPETEEFARVHRWRDACVAHESAQQVCRDEIIKLYYDYAKGAGNGALLAGREFSSFVFEPDWPVRPMPPADKYTLSASDAELGLT